MKLITICSIKMDLEIVSGFVWFNFFTPSTTSIVKFPWFEDLGVSRWKLLHCNNFNCTGFCQVNTILYLLEEVSHWLLRVPCIAHVFKVLLNIYSCDAAIREEDVIKHVSRSIVSKTNKIIIQVHIGSTTVMIWFFSALWTVLYLLKLLWLLPNGAWLNWFVLLSHRPLLLNGHFQGREG
jgi:hypothetical protein